MVSASFDLFEALSCFDAGPVHCQRTRGNSSKPWLVSFRFKHVAFGKAFNVLTARAVVDDFGDMVLLGTEDGQVLLS